MAAAALLLALAAAAVAVQASLSQALPPSSQCPPGCTRFGTCNEELGRCDCPRHMTGPDCSTQLTPDEVNRVCLKHFFHRHDRPQQADTALCTSSPAPRCVLGCNKRGTCVSGWCHCRPGFYGADCSLSLDPATRKPQLLAGLGYSLRAKGPRIYVYELPPQFTTYYRLEFMDRQVHAMLWERVLSAGVRTPDGDGADYYFIPVWARQPMMRDAVVGAVAYIRQTWPWWNQTQGRNHLMYFPGDLGRDEGFLDLRELDNITALSHWGLYVDRTDPLPPHKVFWKRVHDPMRDVVIPTVNHDVEVTALDPLHAPHLLRFQADLANASASRGRLPAAARRLLLDVRTWVSRAVLLRHERRRQRHQSELLTRRLLAIHASSSSGSGGAATSPGRPIFFYHSGSFCGSSYDRRMPSTTKWPNCPGDPRFYSANVRQRVFRYHHNRTGYVVVPHSKTYEEDMSSSVFCLAPTGYGHGKRCTLTTFYGCIPVLITDGVHQPYEPQLDWSAFSVSIKEDDIPKMQELLAAIRPEQLAAMQKAVRCAAQHFYWSSTTGALVDEDGRYDAFETLMEVLRVKAAHPQLAPEQYASADADFRAFMNCASPPSPAAIEAAGAPLSADERTRLQVHRLVANASSNVIAEHGPFKLERSPDISPRHYAALNSSFRLCSARHDCVGKRCGRWDPGGLVCCHAPDAAHCPRMWP